MQNKDFLSIFQGLCAVILLTLGFGGLELRGLGVWVLVSMGI